MGRKCDVGTETEHQYNQATESNIHGYETTNPAGTTETCTKVSQAQQPSGTTACPEPEIPLVTCPTCQQQYPAIRQVSRCPRKFNPLIKFVLLVTHRLHGFIGVKDFRLTFTTRDSSCDEKVDKSFRVYETCVITQYHKRPGVKLYKPRSLKILARVR